MRTSPTTPLLSMVLLSALYVHGIAVAAFAGHDQNISLRVRQAAASEQRIWVFLSDKGPDPLQRASAIQLNERTARRIDRRGGTFDPQNDLPVYAEYRDQLQLAGMVIKQESRWLNAVSGWIHPEDLESIAVIPWVDSLRAVAVFRRPVSEEGDLPPLVPKFLAPAEDVFEYGPSATQQITVIGVNYLHRAGLTGRGVRIGFMDTGFSLGIRAFNCMSILGTRDFINGDEDVGDNDASQMRHGTQCLSLCGAFDEGQMIGVAPAAEYVVAKTELVATEVQAEEDNWVAGLEWLDSMGCDIVSSSLGYTDWYTDDDFDGNTAPSTIAADMAASRGLLVVNAAGNAGSGAGCPGEGPIQLIVPADGDSVLTVGASTFNGSRASFSSCGPTSDGRIKPDVLAPGQGVLTALPNTGAYSPGNGTSFATPLVSGLCALLLEQNPDLSPWDIIMRLRSTATRANKPGIDFGWGIVQAVEAAGIDSNAIEPVRRYDCAQAAGQVVVFPNPAREYALITLEGGTESNGDFRILTIDGRLVYEGEISLRQGTWFGESSGGKTAAPGVYFVQIVTETVNEFVKLAWLPRD